MSKTLSQESLPDFDLLEILRSEPEQPLLALADVSPVELPMISSQGREEFSDEEFSEDGEKSMCEDGEKSMCGSATEEDAEAPSTAIASEEEAALTRSCSSDSPGSTCSPLSARGCDASAATLRAAAVVAAAGGRVDLANAILDASGFGSSALAANDQEADLATWVAADVQVFHMADGEGEWVIEDEYNGCWTTLQGPEEDVSSADDDEQGAPMPSKACPRRQQETRKALVRRRKMRLRHSVQSRARSRKAQLRTQGARPQRGDPSLPAV